MMGSYMASKGLKMLFVGESWNGSSARSLREALGEMPDVTMDDIGEDLYFSKARNLLLQGISRALNPLQRMELEQEIRRRLIAFAPDLLMVYKGTNVSADVIRSAAALGISTINVFPDCSPHAHGRRLREAVGVYDLVVSTKPYHPTSWQCIYGYENSCVCVPHGYDPKVHYWREPAEEQPLDVVMAAGWRPQYESLMREFAGATLDLQLRVGLAGPGWERRRQLFPKGWVLPGALQGRSYGEWLRSGKIVIAPVHADMEVDGVRQPGDQDTTRTYELAAAGCFFLHRRTPFAKMVYDEKSEVPMWDDATELAGLVREFLPLNEIRRAMALKAHYRAVPAYSSVARASQILELATKVVNMKRGDSRK